MLVSFFTEFISLDYLAKEKKVAVKPPPVQYKLVQKRIRSSKRTSYKQYTVQSMWAALNKIEQGLSVYRASIEFGVPRKTLRNWMKKYNILSTFDMRRNKGKTNSDDSS